MPQTAVEIIEEAKASHIRWIKWLQKHPDGGEPEKPVKTAGDATHHEHWVKNYDLVLEVLRGEVNEERLHSHRQD